MRQCVLTLTALVVAVSLCVSVSIADVPQMINYQGVLEDSTGRPLRNDTATVSFRIYDDSTTSTELWAQTTLVETDKNGAFSVLLGSVNPIPDTLFVNPDRWLGSTVRSDPEMTPRTRLVSVPYAYNALRSDTAEYALSPGGGWVDDGAVVRLQDSTDLVGIGNSSPDYTLDVAGNIGVDEYIYHNDNGNHTYLRFLPNQFELAAGTIPIITTYDNEPGPDKVVINETGWGLDFRVESEADTAAFFIDAGNGHVGIGTTTPDEKLTVDGNVHITGDLTVDGTSHLNPIMDYGYEDNVPECGTRDVTFTVTFAAPPSVVVGYKGDQGCDEHGNWFVYNVTTTGFTLRNGRPNQPGGRSAYWIAVGPGQ